MEGNEADEPLNATASVLKELSGTRDEVDRAREAAVQAWLASMPLGEELEMLRTELAAAKNRLAATTAEIPPLKSFIKSTDSAIIAKQEEEGEKQAAVEELRLLVDRGRAELRRMRSEVAAAREAKDALEQRVFIRRQAARALQLVERAVAAENHALAWSAGAAAEQAARARGADDAAHHDVVALPGRRHEELRRGVEAEERKAEERVEGAEALQRAARARRAAAVARLEAARARRQEAAEGRRRRDAEADGRGKMARRERPRSRSESACLVVRKLGSFLCNADKA